MAKNLVLVLVGAVLGGVMSWGVVPQLHKTETSEESHRMHDTMQSMSGKLVGKKGAELDKVFLEEMIVHHEGAVEMARVLVAGTEREEMKQFGDAIIDVQSKEIDMMKQWLTVWFAR